MTSDSEGILKIHHDPMRKLYFNLFAILLWIVVFAVINIMESLIESKNVSCKDTIHIEIQNEIHISSAGFVKDLIVDINIV